MSCYVALLTHKQQQIPARIVLHSVLLTLILTYIFIVVNMNVIRKIRFSGRDGHFAELDCEVDTSMSQANFLNVSCNFTLSKHTINLSLSH